MYSNTTQKDTHPTQKEVDYNTLRKNALDFTIYNTYSQPNDLTLIQNNSLNNISCIENLEDEIRENLYDKLNYSLDNGLHFINDKYKKLNDIFVIINSYNFNINTYKCSGLINFSKMLDIGNKKNDMLLTYKYNDSNPLKILHIHKDENDILLVTDLNDSDISSVSNIFKLLNYDFEFIPLQGSIEKSLSINIKYLQKINYISENGALNVKSKIYESITEKTVNDELQNICSFVEKYGYIIDDDVVIKDTDTKGNDVGNDVVIKHTDIKDNNELSFNNKIKCGTPALPYIDNTELSYTIISNDDYNDYNENKDITKIRFLEEIVKSNSFIIVFNNTTKEHNLLEYNDFKNNWYLDFICSKNFDIQQTFKKLNFDIIKFICRDNSVKEDIKELIKTNLYSNTKEMQTDIHEYIKKITDISSIEYLKRSIKNNYEITNNVKNLIQFTSIFDYIIKIIKQKEDCSNEKIKQIKYILPYVLEILGLKKKRTSKGIMWYGLEIKKD